MLASVACAVGAGVVVPTAPVLAAPGANATGTISGRYSSATGTPLAGFEVQLHNADTGQHVNTAYTETDGTYSFQPAAGTYLLQFRRPDGNVQWGHQKEMSWNADRVTVSSGGSVTFDEVAYATGRIAGRLVDHANAPVQSSTVYAFESNGLSRFLDITDANGQYESPAIPAGPYRIAFTLPGNASARQYAPGKLKQADGTIFNVVGDQTLTVDERLLRTGTLTGHLLTATGQPVAGASVSASSATGGESSAFTQTGPDGGYTITAFPDQYRISIFTDGRSQYFTGAKTHDAADLFTVVGGQVTEASDRLLPTGDLRVTAKNARTGAAVADFCVDADFTSFGCSEGSGEVRLTGVAAGPTRLSFYAPDDRYQFGETTVETHGGVSTDVQLSMLPAATISTVVRDAATGQPVEGACLVPVRAPGGMIGPDSFGVCSDEAGRVTVGRLAGGDYTLFVKAPEGSAYGAQWVGWHGGTGDQLGARIVPAPEGSVVQAPDVRLDRAGTVTGRVTSASDGQPRTQGIVQISATHPGVGAIPAFGGAIQPDGTYTVTGLGPYAWPLLFSSLGKPDQWSGNQGNRFVAQRIQVTAGGTATYDLAMRDGATVKGTTVVTSGTWVVARDVVNNDIVAAGWADEQGRFTIPVLGPLVVRVSDDYGHQSPPVIVPRQGTRTVNLT